MTGHWHHGALDAGGRDLAAGLSAAVALRTMIRRAISALTSTGETDTEHAY
ncbi:hypothetical protein OWR29_26640 [Actinoplanes sp. Pm04-4]|uniref:Uncharacterized protein n=1 Tax=Paractinoplanes pyxinae TaxID=2997416 RepID=A0ABT4B513_9ACTN|nr:hypothetical protein [Actinoplanes pyxinae]MCY1141591.1 hypothetical protein [Actinoplanes pyxinae]